MPTGTIDFMLFGCWELEGGKEEVRYRGDIFKHNPKTTNISEG